MKNSEAKVMTNHKNSGTSSSEEDTLHLSGFEASQCDLDAIISKFSTSLKNGLPEDEAKARIDRFGANEIDDEDDETLFSKYMEKFQDPMILLLLGSAIVSILVGQWDDAISIALAIIIVCTVGFVQEYRSEKALECLKQLTTHNCTVIRDGIPKTINAAELVAGDVVKLSVGDRVPADIRLSDANMLTIEEAIFTGEPKPAKKITEAIQHSDLPSSPKETPLIPDDDAEDEEKTKINIKKVTHVVECKNVAFMGTLVTTGNAKGVVIGTGANTELGKITELMKKIGEKKSPLQKSMDLLSQQISILSFVIIGVIFLIGILTGKGWLEMFTMGISLAVAAIPEGLPIVVTVTLAMGVMRMAKRKAIVRKLPSVESLGATNVICVDKTGTLTQNEMTVSKMYTFKDPDHFIDVTGVGYTATGEFCRYDRSHFSPLVELNHNRGEVLDVHHVNEQHIKMLLTVGNICNNASINDGNLVGQPTEGSLLAVAAKAKIDDQRNVWERIEEIPFSSEEKWMAVQARNPQTGKVLYFVKGAPENILNRSKKYYINEEQSSPLSPADKETISSVSNDFASNSLRTLGLAFGEKLDNLTFCGVVGIYDPPRPGVKEAIKTLHEAAVKVVMITGDSKKTAVSIAKELGIIARSTNEDSVAFSVQDIEQRDFKNRIDDAAVFYRMAPVHKMKIVELYQQKDYVVAMTGDGVNDAPALKLADIGIAMGKSGTDVSKEAAEMILVDDNFATIMAAIEEGKSIFNNIKNFLRYQITTSISCMGIIIYCTLMGLPLPLNPMQILWINIIMDGPPAQSLGVEPADEEVMRQPPRNPKKSIITRKMVVTVLISSLIMVMGTLFIFVREMVADGVVNARDRTMAFTTFVMYQILNAFNCRSEKKSILSLGFFSNTAFLFAVGGSAIGQLCLIYLPFMRFIFETESLYLQDWAMILSVTSVVVIAEEILKFVARSIESKSKNNTQISAGSKLQ